MNVVFFVLIKTEMSTHGTFISIGIELKNDGQRALGDQNWTDRLDQVREMRQKPNNAAIALY